MNKIIKNQTLTAICLTFLLTFLIFDIFESNQVIADLTNQPVNDCPGRRAGGGSH